MNCNYWNDYTHYKTMIGGTYVDDNIDSLPVDHLISELIYE